MPKKVPDYSKSIIYKLCCKDVNITDTYVGSTTSFRKRKCTHKANCNANSKKSHYTVYKTIRANGGWDNWDMVEVERYHAKDKQDLHKREREHMERLNATLNKVVPTRTDEEYRVDNREKMKEYRKEYRRRNRDKLITRDRQYYMENKDKVRQCQRTYRIKNKDKIKDLNRQYLIKNNDKMKKYYKQYQNENKEAISAKRSVKVQCECGSSVSRRNISTHRKSAKHIHFISKK